MTVATTVEGGQTKKRLPWVGLVIGEHLLSWGSFQGVAFCSVGTREYQDWNPRRRSLIARAGQGRRLKCLGRNGDCVPTAFEMPQSRDLTRLGRGAESGEYFGRKKGRSNFVGHGAQDWSRGG